MESRNSQPEETAGAAGGVSATSSSTSDGIRPSNVWRGYPRYLWGIVTLALALNMDQDLDKGLSAKKCPKAISFHRP